MLWLIPCLDKPNSSALRTEHHQEHAAYVRGKVKEGLVFLSGPLLSDDGTPIGSFFIVSAKSRADAQAFADNAPFTKLGLFANITVTRVRKGHVNTAVTDPDNQD
jgi:uncharacterized protein YciI